MNNTEKNKNINYGFKFKLARTLLNLSQTQISEELKISQRDISQIESGKKTFIPTPYIQYMNNKGIDLNSIFSTDTEVCLRYSEVKNTARMTQKGYQPQSIFVHINKKQTKVIENNDLSQITSILEHIVEQPKFNFCRRKNCVYNNSKTSRCIEIANGTCLVFGT